MNDTPSATLSPATSGFVLAAAITVLFNTALAWAKDAYAPLSDTLKSIAGHHWTAHGLIDAVLFACLGFLFTRTNAGGRLKPDRLIATLIVSVLIAGFGLALWYVFV